MKNCSMKIYVCSGTGEAEMEMNAFDKALLNAGIAHYNLILLSSVIPREAEIIERKFPGREGDWGNKLYVVLAKAVQKEKGKKAVAGIGWIRKESGEGLFAEYNGESKEEVEGKIVKTLEEIKRIRGKEFGEIGFKIEEIECTGKNVCAVVAAVYKSEGWSADGERE